MKITDLLDKLEAADKAATRGPWLNPWEQDEPYDNSIMAVGAKEPVACVSYEDAGYLQVRRENAALIALTRNALPGLLAWCREARYMLADLADGGRPQLQAEDLLARDIEVPGD